MSVLDGDAMGDLVLRDFLINVEVDSSCICDGDSSCTDQSHCFYFENLAKVDNGFECGHGEWHIDDIDSLQLVRGSDLPFLASLR